MPKEPPEKSDPAVEVAKLRLECLKLAYTAGGNHQQIIATAEAYLKWICHE